MEGVWGPTLTRYYLYEGLADVNMATYLNITMFSYVTVN
jgi:hypothetical protein